jgi:hypothetical protein
MTLGQRAGVDQRHEGSAHGNSIRRVPTAIAAEARQQNAYGGDSKNWS